MWDSTVPMIPLAMRARTLGDLAAFELPGDYGWRFFQPGDERAWAEIETSAGEFRNTAEALKGFRKYYPTDDELDRRMIFLMERGAPFATATAWFGDAGPGGDEGRLHWVGIDAAHQRRGLSYPLVSLTMRRLRELGHGCAFLTTQTASWPAIKVYRRFGFVPLIREPGEMNGWRIVSEKTGIDFTRDLRTEE